MYNRCLWRRHPRHVVYVIAHRNRAVLITTSKRWDVRARRLPSQVGHAVSTQAFPASKPISEGRQRCDVVFTAAMQAALRSIEPLAGPKRVIRTKIDNHSLRFAAPSAQSVEGMGCS